MFRLFRRLRSKKEETEKEEKKDTTTDTRIDPQPLDAQQREQGGQPTPINESTTIEVERDDSITTIESSTNHTRRSSLESIQQLDKNPMELSTINNEMEIVQSGSSVMEPSQDPSLTQVEQQEHTISNLDVVTQQAETLEDLISDDSPTFSPDELVEAVLFAAGRPLRLEEIIEATELDSTEIKRAITRLKKKLRKQSAFYIKEISNELWVLQLKAKFRPIAVLLRDDQPLLTEEELLILTHIAYRQPISQAVLTKILSYKIDPARLRQVVNNLYLKEYVMMEKKARSVILRTTEKFCREFGFDTDQRRMKIQLIWRLKRQMRQAS